MLNRNFYASFLCHAFFRKIHPCEGRYLCARHKWRKRAVYGKCQGGLGVAFRLSLINPKGMTISFVDPFWLSIFQNPNTYVCSCLPLCLFRSHLPKDTFHSFIQVLLRKREINHLIKISIFVEIWELEKPFVSYFIEKMPFVNEDIRQARVF